MFRIHTHANGGGLALVIGIALEIPTFAIPTIPRNRKVRNSWNSSELFQLFLGPGLEIAAEIANMQQE